VALMARKKRSPAARYAFIGLIVAALACISSAILLLARGAAGLQIFIPPSPEFLDRAMYASIAAIVLGLAAYSILAPDSVRRFLTGRQVRYGSNSVIMSLAFASIIFVANYLVYQNPKRWDLTQDQSHTLAPESRQALATLPQPVQATAFYTSPSDSASQLLQDFKSNGNGKFDYRFENPDLNPIAARDAGITGDGKILLEMEDRTEIAAFASETELTQALIRLISPNERVVYFLTGHGEADINGSGGDSYFTARSTLEKKNYAVKDLNLLSASVIPDDALSVIIAGPRKPLSLQEVAVLKKYVSGGGSLVVLEDPPIFTDFGDSRDPLADYLVRDWGVSLQNDVIIDLTSQNPLQAISASADTTHPITQNLSYKYAVILLQARSLALAEKDGMTQTALLMTSDQSWGETDYQASETGQLAYDDGVDSSGPLNMAVAVENVNTRSRIVVFGNSIFANDDGFDVYGNGNIFVNSVDWSAEQDDLINITPKEPISRTFTPPSSLQLTIIMITSIFVIPGLIVAGAVSSWFSRRKRG
jgi:ABC-type uncharacterized transport system involved in gliding motility auxiliary subunit